MSAMFSFNRGSQATVRRAGAAPRVAMIACFGGAFALLGLGCAPADGEPTGTGGAGAGAGGAVASGGSMGSGGAANATGGASVGSGGASIGSGGASVGTGGADVGSGGASVGSGGASVGTGGAAGGEAGRGGAGTAGRAGGGAGGSTAGTGGGAVGGAGGAIPMPTVPPCATNMMSMCTGTTEIACHFGGNPGNYEVTIELGGATAGNTMMEAEAFRRMLPPMATTAGETKRYSFVTNVRVYENEPLRPDQSGTGKGIPGLDVYFRGTTPRMSAICYKAAPQPLMIWLAGDSTVTDQEVKPYAGWGQHLPQHFVSPIAVANYADSGESSGSFVGSAKLWGAIKAGMKAGDWVFIQLGHNDKDVTASAFQSNLTRMLTDAKAAGVNAVLVTPIARGPGTGSQHVSSMGANLPQIIRDLGRTQNVPVIDLTAKTAAWMPTVTWQNYFVPGDATHTNALGADVFSGFVRDAVRAQLPALAAYLRN